MDNKKARKCRMTPTLQKTITKLYDNTAFLEDDLNRVCQDFERKSEDDTKESELFRKAHEALGEACVYMRDLLWRKTRR